MSGWTAALVIGAPLASMGVAWAVTGSHIWPCCVGLVLAVFIGGAADGFAWLDRTDDDDLDKP